MKKIASLIFSVILCITLAGCSGIQAVNTDDNIETSPLTSSPTRIDSSTESDKSADNLDDMYNAYYTALKNLIQNHILPDGVDCGEQLGDIAENKFAVCDVDNDGREELLLLYTTTYQGGWAGYVLAYDAETKKLQTELLESTLLTFYDNGIIKAEWSHNQGLAGSFWPYSLYQYVPDSDSYVLAGMVDAWDKNYLRSETDNQNNPFPNDIDKSGTGLVYYIMKAGRYDYTHPADVSEYNEWVNSNLKDASKIQIHYMDLTEENISRVRNTAL